MCHKKGTFRPSQLIAHKLLMLKERKPNENSDLSISSEGIQLTELASYHFIFT